MSKFNYIPCNMCQSVKRIKIYYEMDSFHVHNRELIDNISVPRHNDGSLTLITEKFPVYICTPCGKTLHLEDHWEKNKRYSYCILCLSLHECPVCFGKLKDYKKELHPNQYLDFSLDFIIHCPHCKYDFYTAELCFSKK